MTASRHLIAILALVLGLSVAPAKIAAQITIEGPCDIYAAADK